MIMVSDKYGIKNNLVGLWGIEDLPNRIVEVVFDTAWRLASNQVSVDNPEFERVLYRVGLPLLEVTKVCKSVYSREDTITLNPITELINRLEGLSILGTISIVTGGMGREVIEWNYKLSPESRVGESQVNIGNRLKAVKCCDLLLMEGLLNEFGFRQQESWSNIGEGSISCYLGPIV